jgi:hypothetical protein
MPKFTFPAIATIVIALLSSSAIACPGIGPQYRGERSADPEKETYGCVVTAGKQQLLGFVVPARHFGAVTGEEEKDTIGYRPLLGPASQSMQVTGAFRTHAGQ